MLENGVEEWNFNLSLAIHDPVGRENDGMRLAVRGELELESPFLARDIDDEGPALALVA